jgi:MoaA/NifB/PqqE/SkfB family radical SAM enzyme
MIDMKQLIIVGSGSEAARFVQLYRDEGWADVLLLDPADLSSVAQHMPCSFVHVVTPVSTLPDCLFDLAQQHQFPLGISWYGQQLWTEYEQIVLECEKRSVPVMLIYPPLYLAPFLRMRHHIQTGIIGKPRLIRLGVPASPEMLASSIPEPMIASLTLCAKLLGAPVTWARESDGAGHPDEIIGSGADVEVRLSFTGDESAMEIEVEGEGGALELRKWESNWTLKARRNGHKRALVGPEEWDPERDAVRAVIRFATDGTGTMSKGHTGLLSMKSIQDAQTLLSPPHSDPEVPLPQVGQTEETDEYLEMEIFQKLPISRAWRQEAPEVPVMETKLDVAEECNQNCVFCFGRGNRVIPKNLEEYYGVFRILRREGIDGVVLSGGEPTLEPLLPEIIAEARRAGLAHATIETNAILCDNAELVQRLVDSGLDSAFVSFHSCHVETVDKISGTIGSLPRTIAGIRNLCAGGVDVHLNCVINRHNFTELEDLVLFVTSNLPGVSSVTFSYVAPLGRAAANPELVPPIEETVSHLRKALLAGERQGMVVMVPPRCGVPQCFLPRMERFFVEHQMRHLGAMFHLPTCDRVKSDVCAMCTKDRYCQGLWAGYARLYGTDKLKPLLPRVGGLAEEGS